MNNTISQGPWLEDRRPPVDLQGSSPSSTSSFCRISNASAGMGGKSSIVAEWKKGVESASVLSGNDGMTAAVLSPGGLFTNKNKKE